MNARSGEVAPEEADPALAAWQQDVRRHVLSQLAYAPQRPWSRWRAGTLALLLLLHLALLIGLRDAMRPGPANEETFIEVRFLAAGEPEPPLPQTPRRDVAAAQSSPRRTANSDPPAAAPVDAMPERAASALMLFNPDGSVRLPDAAALPAPTAAALAAELMHRGHNIVHCRTTRFAGVYARDESLGDEISRKYLVWVGLYNRAIVEARAARRRAEAIAACDGKKGSG